MENANKFLGEVVAWLRELADGTDMVKQSEFLRQYLDVMSKFWKYSYHNQLLRACQMPNASHTVRFRKWRKMMRCWKKSVIG